MSIAKTPETHVPCQTYSAAGQRRPDLSEVSRVAAEVLEAGKEDRSCSR